MLNTENLDNFGKLVLNNYKFLVDEYDFSFVKEGDWEYKFENATTRVVVMMEQAINLLVEVEPIGESARSLLRQNILPSRLDVISISMCLDKNLKYKIEKVSDKNMAINVPVEIEKQAYLLRKYCQALLQGNFSDWPQIKECLSKRSKEFLDIFWK